jgi:hypothetical protein
MVTRITLSSKKAQLEKHITLAIWKAAVVVMILLIKKAQSLPWSLKSQVLNKDRHSWLVVAQRRFRKLMVP